MASNNVTSIFERSGFLNLSLKDLVSELSVTLKTVTLIDDPLPKVLNGKLKDLEDVKN